MSFPFIKKRVNTGTLSIYSLWMDIAGSAWKQFMGKNA